MKYNIFELNYKWWQLEYSREMDFWNKSLPDDPAVWCNWEMPFLFTPFSGSWFAFNAKSLDMITSSCWTFPLLDVDFEAMPNA